MNATKVKAFIYAVFFTVFIPALFFVQRVRLWWKGESWRASGIILDMARKSFKENPGRPPTSELEKELLRRLQK